MASRRVPLSRVLSSMTAAGEVTVDASWLQGRTAFGGLSANIGLTAARQALREPSVPLRSLMVSFIAPLGPGVASTAVTVLKEGGSMQQVRADVIQDNKICTSVVGAFGVSRSVSQSVVLPPLDQADLPEMDRIPSAKFPPGTPRFLQHFEAKFAEGAPFQPVANPARSRARVWLRHLDTDGIEGQQQQPSDQLLNNANRIVAMADMPPPLIFLSYSPTMPPMASSVTWMLDFAVPPEGVSDPWLLLDYTVESAMDGYSQQSGRIYDSRGRIVAYSRQCMAYFEPKPSSSSA